MTNLRVFAQPDSFESDDRKKEFLAKALKQGRLRLVLGAGVSRACELPSWEELVTKISENLRIDPKGKSLEEKSNWLLRKGVDGDRKKFAETVRSTLYHEYDGTLKGLSSYPLMIALGALSMPGYRGSVQEIVTFNFDDLLERYLKHHGFFVKSTSVLPTWSTRAEVNVFHIHGLLPFEEKENIPRDIVFTQADFDKVVGNRADIWNQRVTQIFQSNICVFIGLSGDDPNLRSILQSSANTHASDGSYAYWGVRFANDNDDPRKDDFEESRIIQVTIPHEEIPAWLLNVAQIAMDL